MVATLVNYLLKMDDITVINLDKLTYAGNLESLQDVMDNGLTHLDTGRHRRPWTG